MLMDRCMSKVCPFLHRLARIHLGSLSPKCIKKRSLLRYWGRVIILSNIKFIIIKPTLCPLCLIILIWSCWNLYYIFHCPFCSLLSSSRRLLSKDMPMLKCRKKNWYYSKIVLPLWSFFKSLIQSVLCNLNFQYLIMQVHTSEIFPNKIHTQTSGLTRVYINCY